MPPKKFNKILAVFLAVFVSASFSFYNFTVEAALVDELRQKIKDNNSEIEKIQKEIEQIQGNLKNNAKEAASLKEKINGLEKTKKKLAADISLTQKQIKAAELNIEKLGFEINSKEEDIAGKKESLAEFIRAMNESESATILEITLAEETFSDFFGNLQRLNDFKKEINDNLERLKNLKKGLESQKQEEESQKKNMEKLKGQYQDQKQLVEINKETTNKLLKDTKNNEARYQKLLAEKETEKERFEEDLRNLESQLKFELNPKSIPSPGTKVLSWPLDKIRVTQYFGDTEFSRNGAYNGRGHNGMDFSVDIDKRPAEVKAALGGEIVAVNTQTAYMCQYGKWVLIRHANGLSTLYAHLSLIPDRIKTGQHVETGQIIGYTGDTGYATGHHLHFTVYASNAVQFKQYTCKSGATLTIPVAAYSGYLNPMDYL